MKHDPMTGMSETDSMVIRRQEGDYLIILERWYSEYEQEFFTAVSLFEGNAEVFHSGITDAEFSLESAEREMQTAKKLVEITKGL